MKASRYCIGASKPDRYRAVAAIGFADLRGNKQFISTGNLGTDNRVALIMVDYPRQTRLKFLGRAAVFEGESAREWIECLREPGYKAVLERAYVIKVEAFELDCPQDTTLRFTAEQIQGRPRAIRASFAGSGVGKQKLREAARSDRQHAQNT